MAEQKPPLDAYDQAVMKRMGGNGFYRAGLSGADDPANASEADQMRLNRAVTRRQQKTAVSESGVGSMQFATGRPRDPLFYWKQNNLPYDFGDDNQLMALRRYCRLLYASHPYIASCIDIFTKYPLLGRELTCKNNDLTEFYTDLFFSEEGLNYDEFLLDFGREYWTVGEAIPFGSFNEALGVWEDEEFLNPDDVVVEQSPFLKEPRYFIRLPERLRRVLKDRSPVWEYQQLISAYPELVQYADDNARMPVSSILLQHYKFKADTFSLRGIPLLMRTMRSVMQEEMLNSAVDAIADRLYTPLILVKLGASATDLGTQTPWIPTGDDLEDFNERFDMAMAADFRVLTHHFGIEVESVFGREQVPDLSMDFDRIEDRILQGFGLSRTMLTGASSGETYAADALNRDIVSQLLTKFQEIVKRHYRQRALVVAEAQGHYDYEVRGGKRYVKMEEILEVDEDGTQRIVERPKLLIPDLNFKTMSIQNEEAEREFLESLRASGVPISMRTRMRNLPIDLEDEIETSQDEAVKLAVGEQETRKAQFMALRAAGLPIPTDLLEDFQPKANNTPDGATEGSRVPVMGVDPTVTTPNLAATQEDLGADQAPGAVMPGMPTIAVDPMMGGMGGGIGLGLPQPGDTRPPESDEQREDMPKAASNLNQGDLWRGAEQMRQVTAAHYVEPQRTLKEEITEVVDGKQVTRTVEHDLGLPQGKFAAPKHIGMRAYAHVEKDRPMEEWGQPQDGPQDA